MLPKHTTIITAIIIIIIIIITVIIRDQISVFRVLKLKSVRGRRTHVGMCAMWLHIPFRMWM